MTLQTSTSPANCARLDRARQIRRWLVIILVSVTIPVATSWVLHRASWDVTENESRSWRSWEWDGKPRFVATVYDKINAPPNATAWQRLKVSYLNLDQRYGVKRPAKHSLCPDWEKRCEIHHYLNQCMNLTGTRYLIAEEANYVYFGHSNFLNGVEWVAAFEGALQTNQPACWHPSSNHMWQENLLLIHESPRLVKVIPPSRLADYQKAGLVSTSYVPPKSSSETPPRE